MALSAKASAEAIVDVHCHPMAAAQADYLPYMPAAHAERFERTHFELPHFSIHPGGGTLPEDQEFLTPQAFAASLPASVGLAVLSSHQALPAVGWCDTKMNSVYHSALNGYFLEHWIPADPRFRLAISINSAEPLLSAQEMRRYADDERVIAASMALVNVNLGQDHYVPIYEAAVETGMALIIHPGGQEGDVVGVPRIGGVGPYRKEEKYLLLPQVAAINISSVIFDGMFVRFPALKLIFAGFGWDWIHAIIWRANMEWRNQHVDVPWVVEPPQNFLGKNVQLVFDDISRAPRAIISQLAQSLPERALVYGSNRPFVFDGDPEAMLTALPDGLRDRIAHLNAQETFAARAARFGRAAA